MVGSLRSTHPAVGELPFREKLAGTAAGTDCRRGRSWRPAIHQLLQLPIDATAEAFEVPQLDLDRDIPVVPTHGNVMLTLGFFALHGNVPCWQNFQVTLYYERQTGLV
jgi:hypothetical protein